jgi:hypothetical protein
MLMGRGCIWVRRFKLSNDPQFAAKLKAIGLWVNPPNTMPSCRRSMRSAKFRH